MSTYKQAGVDREKADRLVDRIGALQAGTETEDGGALLDGFGGFSAAMDPGPLDDPVVTATCDGVGTKLKLLLDHDRPGTAGRDLVAMNVNDILTSGARPRLFLDYLAMAPLEESTVEGIVQGVADACREVGCVLGGGETAELPDILDPGDVELSGFCVGVVERSRLRRSGDIEPGHRLIGLPSEGFHANGYSLIRQLLRDHPDAFDESAREGLLEPTRLYHPEVERLRETDLMPDAMVHVTGGGLPGNLERVLPEELGARVQLPPWDHPAAEPVLSLVEEGEAARTFNMGIGWVMVARNDRAETLRDVLDEAVPIGEVRPGPIEVSRGDAQPPREDEHDG